MPTQETSPICLVSRQPILTGMDCTLLVLQQEDQDLMQFTPDNAQEHILLPRPNPSLDATSHWSPFGAFIQAQYHGDYFKLKESIGNRIVLQQLFIALAAKGGPTRGSNWVAKHKSWLLPDTPEAKTFLEASTLAELTALPLSDLQRSWDVLTNPLIYGSVIVDYGTPRPLQLMVLHRTTYEHLVDMRYTIRANWLKDLLRKRDNLLPVFQRLTKTQVEGEQLHAEELAKGFEIYKALSEKFEIKSGDSSSIQTTYVNWLVNSARSRSLTAEDEPVFRELVTAYACWKSIKYLGLPLQPLQILPTSGVRAHTYAALCAKLDATLSK